MNNILINRLLIKNNNRGFTLIELLVVIIIIGVLAAVSFPNLINQIGKARESEAKNNLGTMARAQQIYHFENKTFADTIDKLSTNATFTGKYYSYADADVSSNSIVKQRAISLASDSNRTKDYAIGVYFNSGAYQFIFCQAKEVGAIVEAPNVAIDGCTNDGVEIN